MRKGMIVVIGLVTLFMVCFTVSLVVTAKIDDQKQASNQTLTSNKGGTIKPTTKPTKSTTVTPTEAPITIPGVTIGPDISARIPTPPIVSIDPYPETLISPDNTIKPVTTPKPTIKKTPTPTPAISTPKPSTTNPGGSTSGTGYVISAVFTHPKPETSSGVVTTLQKGTIITIIGETGGWYELSNGTYVWGSFISLNKPTTTSTTSTTPTPAVTSVALTSRGGGTASSPLTLQLTTYSNLVLSQVNILIKSTGFSSDGASILNAEKNHKVNAFFIIGVAKHESANGYSSLAVSKNNFFGIKLSSGPYRTFTTHNECFDYFANLIRGSYFDKGLTTLSSIQNKYCEDTTWDEQVNVIMQADLKKVN
jgi:hypothetical protein